MSLFAITDSGEEPDLLDLRFGEAASSDEPASEAFPKAFCPYCGQGIKQEFQYCPKCGKKQ
ncbi:zinc ribbon domain-containing protein [Brevibacillus sp. GCM10020057]|uniref:zinc ribbon domain-containing protein n=1 Tax=Brevibacillus sp. GCM10020057 TaxID=3317327 RepID=UPI00363CFB2E